MINIWDHSSIWRAFFLCVSPSSSARPPTKISVLFLEDLDAALQRLTAPSLTPHPQTEQHSPAPAAAALSSRKAGSVRLLSRSHACTHRAHRAARLGAPAKLSAVWSWSARTEISAGGWAASTISSTEIASELGAGASARPRAARPRGAACVACRREAAGPLEQPQGRERPRPPTQRASPEAILHAPEVISLSSCGSKLALSRRRENESSGSFFFSGSDSLRPAAAQPRQCRSGPQRAHKELHHEVEGRRAWRSVSAQHPQLLQVAPVPQRPRVVSVEAVDLVVEGGERLLLHGLHGYLVRAAAQLREGRAALAAFLQQLRSLSGSLDLPATSKRAAPFRFASAMPWRGAGPAARRSAPSRSRCP